MLISFAKFISFLLNPIIVLVFVPFLLLYKNTHDLYTAVIWTMYTAFFLLAMAAFILYGVQRKLFVDMDVSKREQRPLLFLGSVICCLLYLAGLILLKGPFILHIIAFGVILGIFIASIINKYIKASIHVATISAFIFAVAVAYEGLYLLFLGLIPLVAWSRVKINRHSKQETIVGGILGIALAGIIYALVKVLS